VVRHEHGAIFADGKLRRLETLRPPAFMTPLLGILSFRLRHFSPLPRSLARQCGDASKNIRMAIQFFGGVAVNSSQKGI
jgi:hypothetical protein